jgi:hypothetical protein
VMLAAHNGQKTGQYRHPLPSSYFEKGINKMNYDIIERFFMAVIIILGAGFAIVTFAGIIGVIMHIHSQFDPSYHEKVKQESMYIAKCKSVDGIHVITNDAKYCYKDGRVVEIE